MKPHFSIERLALHKSSDHIQSSARLVVRSNVPCSSNHHLHQILCGTHISSHFLITGIDAPNDLLRLREGILATPLHVREEALSQRRPNDNVQLARVNQHLVVVHERGQLLFKGRHKVLQQMHLALARVGRERLGPGMQGLLDVGLAEKVGIVAKALWAVGTQKIVIVVGAAAVVEVVGIGVDVTVQHLVPHVESLQHFPALDVLDRALAVVLNDGFLVVVHQAQVPHQVRVRRYHALWPNPAVAHSNALQRNHRVDALLVLQVRKVRKAWHIVAPVRFAGDVEVVLALLGENLVKLLQQRVKIGGHADLGVVAIA
eukprot:m.107490 g.107490  ORF g.107490 m.107490 type:complete len:316 (+) comp19050_c1_seq1:610-1557(+)